MPDSDPEYLQSSENGDDGDHDHDLDFDLAGPSSMTYGTRRIGGTVSRTGGIGRAQPEGRARGKQRWEASVVDRGGLGIGEGEGGVGGIGRDLERLREAGMRKRLRQDTQPFQRGIIRHLVLILDLSEAMMEKDMRPNRYIVMLNHSQDYVREFFEQNPISQMCVLAMHDGLCIRVSELSGNPNDHISAIRQLRFPSQGLPKEPKGAPSLQNALDMARGSLYHTPKHGTREAVIIFGALLTLDPGDINKTIKECVKERLRVNIIGMSGTMRICQEICSKTNSGDESCYTVALDAGHLRDLLMATTTPPVIRRGTEEERDVNRASLLMMGFPSRIDEDRPTLCACHGTPTRGGYTCSRCRAKVCGLPVTCPSCALTLILSTHLARSYHHLFPLRNWVTVSWQRAREVGSVQCKACLSSFPPIPSEVKGKDKDTTGREAQANSVEMIEEQAASESSRYECQSCGNHFCIDCDLFCHEVVHNCPGCLSTAPLSISNDMNGVAG